MTQKASVLIKKKALPETRVEVAATVTISDEDKYFVSPTTGWSTHREERKENRGLNFAIQDNIEILIPYAEIRKFVKYMDANGL